MKKTIIAGVILVAFLIYSVATAKIVKTGEEYLLTGGKFNAGDSVAAIWDSKALPDLQGKAVDINKFLTEAKGDFKSKTLADKYGKYSMGTQGELSYTVKGKATVTSVNQEKKAGYMEVKLDGYTGSEVIRIQIGSVYKGSAVRDSLSFIKFEDYTNQVDYAAISQSIHDVIQKTVIGNIDLTSIEGKKIEFLGCFTADSNTTLLITPVSLKLI
jgi:predicted lipoprotein